MLLENYLDKGILLEQLLAASKRAQITFSNGRIVIGGVSQNVGGITLGDDGVDYTLALLTDAIDVAYREGK